jgi:hypothetical protein
MFDNNSNNYGILSFQMNHLLEKTFTKKAILNWFRADDSIINTCQCLGGVQIIKKNKHTINIINTWMYNMRYELIDDYTNCENPDFIENRRDQSIYSLTVKKLGSVKLPDETWFEDLSDGINFSILAKRIR